MNVYVNVYVSVNVNVSGIGIGHCDWFEMGYHISYVSCVVVVCVVDRGNMLVFVCMVVVNDYVVVVWCVDWYVNVSVSYVVYVCDCVF